MVLIASNYSDSLISVLRATANASIANAMANNITSIIYFLHYRHYVSHETLNIRTSNSKYFKSIDPFNFLLCPKSYIFYHDVASML